MKGKIHVAGRIAAAILLVCLLAAGFLYVNNDIGKPAGRLESDIRSSQKIQDDWTVTGSVSDTMAGFISYPQNLSDHTFSVYVNRPGVSFGYFFRGGGSLSSVERYIAEFTVEGYSERAFISMNAQKAARVEIDNGNDIEVIEIDSEKPFALVLPGNAGDITFYDVNGEVVEYGGQRL